MIAYTEIKRQVLISTLLQSWNYHLSQCFSVQKEGDIISSLSTIPGELILNVKFTALINYYVYEHDHRRTDVKKRK